MDKKKKKTINPLDIKHEQLEQYDNRGDEEILLNKKTEYAFYIGEFLIDFSSLEHEIDIGLANQIHSRTHEVGYLIFKDLEISNKINLLYSLLFQYFSYGNEKKKIEKLEDLFKGLENVVRLRNKIVHGKWHTLDNKGYIRVDIKFNKGIGRSVIFRKMKINLPILKKAVRDLEKITEKLSDFLLPFS